MSNHDRPSLSRRRFIELAAGTAAVASGLLTTPIRACLIFPGKDVHVRGWCSVYAPRQ